VPKSDRTISFWQARSLFGCQKLIGAITFWLPKVDFWHDQFLALHRLGSNGMRHEK
jgi:hypothetical protein